MVARDEKLDLAPTTKAPTKAKKRRSRAKRPRQIAGPSEEFIYSGSLLIGMIHGSAGVFRAVDASGKPLGRHKTSNAAMAAIIEAVRPRTVAQPIDADSSSKTASLLTP